MDVNSCEMEGFSFTAVTCHRDVPYKQDWDWGGNS